MRRGDARRLALGAGSWRAAPYWGVVALGGLVWWASRTHPAGLPVWAPWDFSWVEYLAFALSLWWFAVGLVHVQPVERTPIWRGAAFLLGMATLYAVLQTHIEYLTQHMFFLNRLQHIAMHHLGPFLIALGQPGPTILRGMPRPVSRLARSPPIRRLIGVLQQPAVAAVLFVGLIYFWLIPAVNFRAMIDPGLYDLMNWSMVLDGLLFWSLVLDPRAKPPARISFVARASLPVLIMFPQIALGALIAFAGTDLYPYYDYCGRLFPSIGALKDQMIGGLVIWIPPAMMSVVALLLVLNAVRVQEEENEDELDDAARAMANAAHSWTGR